MWLCLSLPSLSLPPSLSYTHVMAHALCAHAQRLDSALGEDLRRKMQEVLRAKGINPHTYRSYNIHQKPAAVVEAAAAAAAKQTAK